MSETTVAGATNTVSTFYSFVSNKGSLYAEERMHLTSRTVCATLHS